MSATVVSAFYPLKKSKHDITKYRQWIQNFCQIPCNLTVFTDADTAPQITAARGELPIHVVIKPFNSYAMTTPDMMRFWEEQHTKDPEAAIHNPELYAIWAMKQECVALAIADNVFASEWFVWCDIGIHRKESQKSLYMNFPKRVADLCDPGRISMLVVSPISTYIVTQWKAHVALRQIGYPAHALGGGCIAGDIAAWTDFARAYQAMLDTFRSNGWFAGKDENVYFMMLVGHATQKPFKLYYSTNHAGLDHWMSMPVILGGDAPVFIDSRFC